MPRFHARVRAIVVGVSALALVTVAVGGTVAASNPTTVYACFDVNGNVRMSASALCQLPGGGRLVTINASGVAGPAGATGVAGPIGATGVAGPIGVTGATGPAGSARAWAEVAADGSLLRSYDMVASGFILTGVYCVWPVGYDAASMVAIVTQELANPVITTATAYVNGCADGPHGRGIQVNLFAGATPTNGAFYIAVP